MAFAQLVDSRPRGPVLSPSQVETYDLCKRKWALKYIAKLPDPQKPSAKLGTSVHEVLEGWLRSGIPPDMRTQEGRIAARMIRHLPPPGVGACERTFYFITKNGVAWTGKIDWSGVWEGWPTVIDHKTTGNLEWAKSEAQLHSDPQALIYTVAGSLGFGTDEMQIMWGYGETKGRDAQTLPVKTKLRLPVVIEKFDAILDPFAIEILQIDRGQFHPGSPEGIDYAKMFPPTATACSAFGGCAFQNVCNLSEAERLGAFMTMAPPPTLATRLANIPPVPGGGFAAPGGIPPLPAAPGLPPPLPAAPGLAPPPIPAGGFAPPGAPPALPAAPSFAQPTPHTHGGFAPPALPTAPPALPAVPPMPAAPLAPPGAPTQTGFAFQPPQLAAAALGQPPYPPQQAPNPPESGIAAPQTAVDASGGNGAAKRGRPRGSKNKDGATAEAMRDASVGSPALGERIAFACGVAAFLSNGEATPDRLLWAGQMAVHVYKQQYPSG